MKVYAIFAAALVTASIAAAGIPEDLDEIYTAAKADAAAGQKLMEVKGRIFNRMKYSSRWRKLRLDYDKKLGALGMQLHWWDSQSYPVMSANERKALGLDKSLANTVAICAKYKCNITPYGLIKMAEMTPDEAVAVFNEFIYRLDHISTDWLLVLQSYLATNAGSIAKAHLVKAGSYKDGDEAKYVAALGDALAKPYYGGLNDWLASVGVSARVVDISKLWKPEDVAALKAKILAGDVALTDSFALRLQIALGLEQYNSFIDSYKEGL